MNRLVTLLSSEFCGNIVLALLHTLWQAVIITVLLYMFLRSKTGKEASKRYMASIVALAAIVLCGLFTWAVLNYEPLNIQQSGSSNLVRNQTAEIMSNSEEGDNVVSITQTESHKKQSSQVFGSATWSVWVMCLWMIGVMIMLCRTVHIVIGAGRLRRQCRLLENEPVLELIEQLRQSMGIARKICVAVNDHICVPGVIGFVWPTLLLPASMISGIPIDDLKAILSHELAHIRRYDYLVNFCQMIIEALLFFNPAVWWISRQIRIEREACCDATGAALTGEKVGYARVLADWAHRLADRRGGAASSAIIGFAGSDQSGSMLDRVKRIVVPGHRPKMKVAWYVTVALLMASAILLAGLWQGTNLTVAFVAKILTPAERIEKIAEIHKTHGFEDREYGEEDKITITGRIRTYDNKPLPDHSYISIRNVRPHHSGTTGISISESGPFSRDGNLSLKVEFGTVWIGAEAEGYGPGFVGPLKTGPGGEIKDVEIVLEKGFKGQIKIIDDSGQPVAGAHLKGGYLYFPGSYSYTIEITSDSDGIATIEHTSSQTMAMQMSVDGYEHDTRKDIRLRPDKPVLWQLKSSAETSGIVLSNKTGKPVAAAQVRLLALIGGGSIGSHSYGRNGSPMLATTDDKGTFTLNTLRKDSRYILSVEAPNHGHRILYYVMAGQKDLQVYLPEELRITGRIIGPLEQLRQRDGKPVISYTSGLRFDDEGHWDVSKYANVEIRDGVGYFELTDLWGNKVNIGSGSYRKRVDIGDEETEEVIIDLSDKLTDAGKEYKSRTLIFKFDYPEGMPPPQGTIRVHYIDPDHAENTYKSKILAIDNGVVTLDIPTPGKIGYEKKELLGYWFAEKREIKVPYADDPFVVTIPVIPAGSIYGEVFERDGGKASNVLVSVVEIEKSPLKEGSLRVRGKNSAGPSDADAKFILSPLPLDGTYVVVARQGESTVVSEPIKLDERKPIWEINLNLVEGVDLEGKIVGAEGEPIAGIMFRLSYQHKHHGFGGRKRYTDDSKGRFIIEHVNPDLPGYYQIEIDSNRDYRPVRIKLDDLSKPVTIRLEKGHIVSGVVIDDATGWPVPGVEVYALPEDYSKPEPTGHLDAEEKTDEHGQFRFSNMAKRKYRLGVRSANLANPRTSVTATGGQEEPVTLRIKIPEWSDLKPRKPAF